MANRMINNHSRSDADRRGADHNNSPANIKYVPDPLTRTGPHFKHNLSIDDVIVSLANAYENRRARQTTEWERVGRQKIGVVL